MIDVTKCPICSGQEFKTVLLVKDHTVSGKLFSIKKCLQCGFHLTSPRPATDDLGDYYKSENYISHTGTARSITDRIYLKARTYTLRWKQNLIRRYTDEKTLLDYGCGTGEFLAFCKSNNWKITGVEPSPLANQQASKITGTEVYKSIALVDYEVSVITLWHVLEHVPDLNETLTKLKSRLKENGTMFIAVPNLNSWDAQHYDEDWAAYDTPRHLWHFGKSQMTKLLHNHQLKLENIIPMKLDPFYISLLSEKYRTAHNGLPALTRAFYTGLRSNYEARKTGEYSSLIYIVKNDA